MSLREITSVVPQWKCEETLSFSCSLMPDVKGMI